MRKYLLFVPVGLVVLLVGGVLLYTKVIADDPPERLGFQSPTSEAGTNATGSASGAIDGTWNVVAPSQAGYRAKEILFGQSVTAVGRTSSVTGTMTVQGTTVTAASFSVDMTTVKSDSNQRDGQFQGRIMQTSQFPTAEFVLGAPVELGALPDDQREVTVPTTGRLTLKGTGRDVSFELRARRSSGTLEVNGTIPVRFADYGIDNPSGGPARVGDDGEVEVLLVFAKAP